MHKNMDQGIPVSKLVRDVTSTFEECSWRMLTCSISKVVFLDEIKGSSQFQSQTAFFFFLPHFELLPFRGMSLWSQGIYPSLPWYMPCILISRIGSALPHRVNSHQTNSIDYFVCSRVHTFHGGNNTMRRKTQRIGDRTLDFHPNGENSDH